VGKEIVTGISELTSVLVSIETVDILVSKLIVVGLFVVTCLVLEYPRYVVGDVGPDVVVDNRASSTGGSPAHSCTCILEAWFCM